MILICFFCLICDLYLGNPNSITKIGYRQLSYNISRYYRRSDFEKFMSLLGRIGGTQLVDAFRRTCFKHLLFDLDFGYKCTYAHHYLASRLLKIYDGDEECSFYICGHTVSLTPIHFALVIRLNFGRSTFDPTADHNLRAFKVFCGG